MILYGIERALVEGLRTDSLYIGSTNIRVSQLLSIILIVFGITMFIDSRRRFKKEQAEVLGTESVDSGLSSVIERYDAALAEDDANAQEVELISNQNDEIEAYNDDVTNEDNT